MSEGGCASAVSGDLRSGAPHIHYLSIYPRLPFLIASSGDLWSGAPRETYLPINKSHKKTSNFDIIYFCLLCHKPTTHKRIFFYINMPLLLIKILSDACVEALLIYRDAPNPISACGEHIPPKHQRGSFRTYTKFHIPKLKCKWPIHTKLLAPNDLISLSYRTQYCVWNDNVYYELKKKNRLKYLSATWPVLEDFLGLLKVSLSRHNNRGPLPGSHNHWVY